MRPRTLARSKLAQAFRCALAIALVVMLAIPAIAAPRQALAADGINSASNLTWEELKPHLEEGLGVPYSFGGASTAGWDCSGYASWAFNTFGGTGYTHYTVSFEQELADRGCFVMEGNGNNLRDERMEPGDIIFFYSEGVDRCTHMGIVGERVDGIVMVYHAFSNSFSDIYGNRGTMLQGLDANPESSLRGIWYMSSGHGKGNWSKFTVYRGVVSTGSLSLYKHTANASVTDANANYTLEGATYGIYANENDARANSNPIATMTCDANGFAYHDKLLQGRYFVREMAPSAGFALDDNVYEATITSGNNTDLNVEEQPQTNPISLWLAKHDAETGEQSPLGGASLAKAQFEFTFYGGQYNSLDEAEQARTSGIASRSWTMQTDETGNIDFGSANATFDIHDSEGNVVESAPYFVSGDDLYTDSKGNIVLPLGTVFVKESQAPEGYLIDTSCIGPIHITGEGAGETVDRYVNPNVADRVKRGDISFSKVHEQTMERMPNVAFSVTSMTTGETHIVVTDENGMVDTSSAWNSHAYLTNENDFLLTAQEEADSSKDPSDKAPSGETATETENETAIETNADNKGSNEPEASSAESDRNDKDANSADAADGARKAKQDALANDDSACGENDADGKDAKDASAGTANAPEEQNSSEATERSDADRADGQNSAGAIANPTSNAAKPNDDKEPPSNESERTANPLAGIWFSGTTAKTTTPNDALGALPYDTYRIVELPGATNAGMTMAEFTVTVSRDHVALDLGTVDDKAASAIHTTLVNEQGEHLASAQSEITLTDTVEYDNLIPGKTYTLSGTLHRVGTDENGAKVDNGELQDAAGQSVSASRTFVPDMTHGTTSLTFTFNASDLSGCTVVAFETLSLDDKEAAVHADAADEDQTVYFPAIQTSLGAAESGEISSVGTCKLVDTVTFSHLQPNKTYEMVASLHVKDESGNDAGVALDASGNPITAKQSFTAQESSGSVEVTFAFDAPTLAGSTVVAFEELTRNAIVYAAHADINDSAQSAALPHIATSAQDAGDGDSSIEPTGQAHVRDHVAFSNLCPQKSYRMVATLHKASQAADGTVIDAGTLKDGNGKDITAEVAFTPEEPNGTVEIDINFPAEQLAGSAIVVFEECYCGDVLVAQHADITDEGQTVTVLDPKGSKEKPGSSASDGKAFAKTGNPLLDYAWIIAALLASGAIAGCVAIGSARKSNSTRRRTYRPRPRRP